MTPFDAYKLFTGLKLHFTTKYDYIKYNGQVKVTQENLDTKKDKYQYYRLSKQKQPVELIISNFAYRKKVGWVGELFSEEAQQYCKEFIRRKESRFYLFQQDMDKITSKKQLVPQNGEVPEIINFFNKKQIMIETLCLLNDMTQCFSDWEQKIDDTVIFPTIKNRIEKYQPFVDYDEDKFSDFLYGKLNAIRSL